MKKKIVYILCILLPLTLLFSFRSHTEEKKEVRPVRQNEVTVLQVQKQNYPQYLTAYGKIENDKQIKLSVEANGKVENLKVEEGQFVYKGQILLSLNKTAQNNATEQLQAETAQSNFKLSNLYLERENLRKNLSSLQNLYADGVATLEEKEQGQLQLDLVNNKIRIQEGQLESINKKMELANYQLGLSSLFAPQNGVVEKVMIKQYEQVGAGQEVIRFSPSSAQATVTLNLNAKEVSNVKKGQVANVSVDFPQEKTYSGTVKSISYNNAEKQNAYKVVVAFQAGQDKQVYGALVKVAVQMEEEIEGFKIPFDAIDQVTADSLELLLVQADNLLQKKRFAYREIEGPQVLVDYKAEDALNIVVDKSIGLKALEEVQVINYR